MTDEPAPLPMPLSRARVVFPPLWVVYERPADFPMGYVVRLWWGLTPEPVAHPFSTLRQARLFILDAGGCARFAPQQGDEPQVLESWL